jgi:protein SCO1/2
LDWNPGNQFEVVVISFDPREGADLAQKKKANYMKLYGRPGTESGFHFLTADQKTIDELMSSVGFKYKWNEKAGEWSHASAVIMLTPEGKIARYLNGVEFDPKDMKLGLNETAHGKMGNIIDFAITYCFKYDQHQSKYGLQVFRVVQLMGIVTMLILAIWLLPVLYKAGREKI